MQTVENKVVIITGACKCLRFGGAPQQSGLMKTPLSAFQQSIIENAPFSPEVHPYSQEKELKAFLDKEGIVIQAWYPLGHGDKKLLKEKLFAALAQKYGKSTSQIILRWHIQSGNIVIPGSKNPQHTIKKIVATVEKEFGHLDILVNNAGWCPVQPIAEMTIADYDRAFQLDVRALVELTIHALPMLRKAKGNIINLSSVGSTHRSRNLSMYQGAKAAVDNFTRVWALELAQDGVRVNAIAPGAIRTNIWNVPGLSPEEAKKHEDGIAATIPFGRFGAPEDIANMAAFLVSDEASYISGGIFAVDGAQGAL